MGVQNLDLNIRTIYHLKLISKDFTLIMKILKNSGSPKAVELAEKMDKQRKDHVKAIASQLGIELAIKSNEEDEDEP